MTFFDLKSEQKILQMKDQVSFIYQKIKEDDEYKTARFFLVGDLTSEKDERKISY